MKCSVIITGHVKIYCLPCINTFSFSPHASINIMTLVHTITIYICIYVLCVCVCVRFCVYLYVRVTFGTHGIKWPLQTCLQHAHACKSVSNTHTHKHKVNAHVCGKLVWWHVCVHVCMSVCLYRCLPCVK